MRWTGCCCRWTARSHTGLRCGWAPIRRSTCATGSRCRCPGRPLADSHRHAGDRRDRPPGRRRRARQRLPAAHRRLPGEDLRRRPHPRRLLPREGRPSEGEILTSRLIDRPIRPLFADGFGREVQVIATVKSLNPAVNPEVPALIGVSAALAISGAPFNGPIGAARVGYKNGEYLLNPAVVGSARTATWTWSSPAPTAPC
jgi:hypothetical protein